MVNEQRLLNEFLTLVKIDSETKFETEICAYLKEKLTALGLEVIEDDTKQKTGHGAGNLIATLQGNSKAPTIFFTAHMDTVTPGKGVKPVVKDDGYIYSDGTTILGSDDKAGLAAIIEGIQLLKERKVAHGDVQLVLTVGEEAGLVGAKALDPQMIKAEFGFAFDSNGPVGDVIIQAPTQAKIRARIHGKAAHAGVNPEEGISAIQVASNAIAKMKLGRIDQQTTANIGSFIAEGPTNIVCEQVDILAEARSLVPEKMDQQVAHMKASFEESAQAFGTTAEVEIEVMYPGFQFSEEERVVQIAQAALKRIGRSPRLLASGGGSDANIFAGYGIPTVNMGIGYEHIHSKAERMPISELIKAAELFVALVQETVNR